MTRTDYITVFRGAAGSEPFASDELVLQAWSEADWSRLFDHTQTRPYRASEVVIQRRPSTARSTWSRRDRSKSESTRLTA